MRFIEGRVGSGTSCSARCGAAIAPPPVCDNPTRQWNGYPALGENGGFSFSRKIGRGNSDCFLFHFFSASSDASEVQVKKNQSRKVDKILTPAHHNYYERKGQYDVDRAINAFFTSMGLTRALIP
jgi:hypothetical protein